MRIEKWNSAGTRINYVLTQSGPHFVDASTATVTVSSASASEGDKITFTATLDNAVVGGLTATPTYTNGSGNDKASASDYTTNTNALTFTGTAGETKTFTVQTTEDEIDEADETFTVGLTISNASSRVTASAGTGTINNDDRPTLTVNDASVNEGGTMTFTATLDKATGDDFAVTPTYTNGTAAATDYTANTNAVTFAGTAGETKTFTVQTTQDDVMESNETFTVGLTVSEDLSRPRSMELLLDTTDTGTGTINNDDNAAVTISDASVDEGGTMTFTIALDKAVSSGFTVTPTYTNGTGNDKASATDYTANTASLSFSGTANETKTFTVQTTQDATAEQTETFTVGLTLSGTSLGVDVTDTGIGTINDDDAAKVTVSNASATEGESMTFTLTLDEAASGGFTVNPTFTDGTATGKSGTGKDFQRRIKVNGNYVTDITFTGTAGETKTFTVGTKEDDVVEHDETFTVGLRHTLDSANKTVNLSAVGTGTITNDDEALVTFNNLIRPGIYEGDKGTFTATLDKAVQGGFKATPNFSKGALDKDAAKLGVDYTGDATVLTFAGTAGETKTVTVTTIEDDDVEAKGEPFTVWLAFTDAPSGVRNAKAGGSGIIWDDDRAKVTVNDASTTEGSTMTFTVTLNKTVSSAFTVTPNFTNGTAASTDYTANTTALTFTGTANETKTFTVATTQDDVTESDETFTVGLTVPGDSSVIATDKGTGTITNDDTATLTVNDASADEGESMTFTATLDKKVQGGLTVTPTYTDGTASATDYTANTTAITFTGTANETKTFTVATTEDTDVESDETFTVGLATSNAPADVTATDTGTGTINDDDTARLTVEDVSAAEGDELIFLVTLDKAAGGSFNVALHYTNGTASATDYTANTTARTFTGAAGEVRNFTVQTTEDAVLEPNETFTVGLTVTGASNLIATDTATGTINNDDNPALTISDASAAEGSAMTFTVTLDHPVAGGFTATPTYTNGEGVKYASTSDYTANTTALTFSGTANESKTFTVQTTQDALVENDEIFTVGLTASKSGVTATDTAIGTIQDNDSARVTVEDANANEGDDITFTVTLDQAVSGGFKIGYSLFNITTTTSNKNGKYDKRDFVRGSQESRKLTFAGTKGETQNFKVKTKEDGVVEHDETFRVQLALSEENKDVAVNDDDEAIGTIKNDDTAKVQLNSFIQINVDAINEGDNATFTATLSDSVQGSFTVTPRFSNQGSADAAKPGEDYTGTTTPLTFAGTKGEQKTIAVSTIEDGDVERHEPFKVALYNSTAPAGVSISFQDQGGNGIIKNDDHPTVTVSDASASEGDAISFTVTLDKATKDDFTVTPTYTNGTAASTDYTANTTALSFTKGTAGTNQDLHGSDY